MRAYLRAMAICVALASGGAGQAPNPTPAPAPFDTLPPVTATPSGQKETAKWQIGVVIEALGGPCGGLYATVPVPTDWPEQKVRVVQEDFSPLVSDVRFRVLDRGVKQMLVFVPRLALGTSAQALVTLEVDRVQLPLPPNPESLVVPRRFPREVKIYLGASPYIESRHKQIRDQVRELHDESLPAWKQVEVFYDFVREHVKYMNGPLKGALAALRDKDGDCEELTSLFIALCRADGIPARTVWVPDHCYPEFYLEDSQGAGYWIPCQAAGTRAFGTMPDLRPILQKGDNFKVPEKKERQRYVAEFLKGNRRAGNGKPSVQFIRRRVVENAAVN